MECPIVYIILCCSLINWNCLNTNSSGTEAIHAEFVFYFSN